MSSAPSTMRAEDLAIDHELADTSVGVGGCTGDGAILADGLWAGQDRAGAVVNLSRELAPRLSVDRTKILAYREEDLERLLGQAIDALTSAFRFFAA